MEYANKLNFCLFYSGPLLSSITIIRPEFYEIDGLLLWNGKVAAFMYLDPLHLLKK